MTINIAHHEEIVKDCEGCIFCGKKVVGGDDTIICRRYPYPHTKWWFKQYCKYYLKGEKKKD